jgi:protein-S-isoprenylcysteine O-methyltransferase Ste14
MRDGLVTCAGIGVGCHNWLSLLILAAGPFAAFRYRIAVEERALTGQLGADWAVYRARTGVLLPRLP